MKQKREKLDIAVLVVEDDPSILEQLVQLLSRRVAKVYSCINGSEGLKIFLSQDVDLIISDIDMPVMDGLEFLKAVRAEDEEIPFILSTGLKSLDVLITAIDHGITSFLPKPLQKEKLLKILQRVAPKKRLRNELDKTQDLLTQYKFAIDEAVIVSKTDPKGIITYANDLFCKISGYSKEELVGHPHNIVRDPAMPSSAFKELWDTIKSKKTWHGIISNKAKNGKIYTVQSTIVPILDEDGNIVEYIAFREDITEVVQKDQLLETEREKLYQVLDNMENIVGLSGQEKKLTFINRMFLETFGFIDSNDFLKQHNCFCDLFEEEEGYLQKDMDGMLWTEYLLNNPDKLHKAMMIDKNNVRRIYSVKIKELKEESDIFYLFTLSDITEIDNLRHEAENLAKAKSDFLANMSHEIRTPMNGILGFTKLLKQTNLDEKQKRYLGIIDGSTNTLLGIINDILDFSKLQNGKMELDITNVNPFVEFEKIAMLFMARAKDKDITLKIDIDPNLSECVQFDLLRVQQIVFNLLNNAIKFTPEDGEISLYVKLIDQADENIKVQVGVQDSGIGIPKEAQKKIFEAFSQADGSTTRQFGGTGLGLTISAHLVSLMGGTLEVESQEGVGSRFFFDLTLKSCEPQNHLRKLFNGLGITLVTDTEDLSVCKDKMLEYLNILGINHRVLQADAAQNELRSNEVYLLFCGYKQELLEKLIERNISTVIACAKMESEIYSTHVTVVNDLEHHLSTLYNILLEIGMKKGSDTQEVYHLDNENAKAYAGDILVAEDNEVNQMLIRELLLGYGLEPTIVENGKLAVRETSNREYELILMDVNMPVMGGVEALHLIKEQDINTPVIALTANAMEGDKEMFLGEGFDNYLTKPIMVEDLEKVLDTYLNTTQNNTPLDNAQEERGLGNKQYVDITLIRAELPFPDALIFKLFKSFLDTYSEHIEKLAAGIINRDFGKIEHAAHALSGSSSNIRLTAVAKLTEKLEEAAREKRDVDYQAMYDQLAKVLDKVKLELEEIING